MRPMRHPHADLRNLTPKQRRRLVRGGHSRAEVRQYLHHFVGEWEGCPEGCWSGPYDGTVWGTRHGWRRCNDCGWPFKTYHYFDDVRIIRHLPVHPQFVIKNEEDHNG